MNPTITVESAAQRLANIRVAIAEQSERRDMIDSDTLSAEMALEAAQERERAEHKRDAALRQRITDLERQASAARAEMMAAKRLPEEQEATQSYDALMRELGIGRQTLAASDKTWGKRQAEHATTQAKLAAQIAEGHAQFEEAHAVLMALRDKEREAHQDVGECLYASLAHEMNEQQEVCENIKAVLDEQEAEQVQMIREAIERLHEWPELAARFRATYGPQEPAPEDSVTRLADAWLAFWRVLEQDGAAAGTDSEAQRLLALMPLPENTLRQLVSTPDWLGNIGSGLGAQPRSRIFADRRAALEAARNDHASALAKRLRMRLAGRALD